jgi:SAM-dependent methyltransferase
MGEGFKDHFSATADSYRLYRPGYPAALFDWLARSVPQPETALDCGCGNGQAAVALAEHFTRVHAVDPSAEQIENAIPHERVEYRVAPAEATGVEAGSVDLIVVAQALHWFDLGRFYAEVRRVARPGAVLAAFTYGLLSIDPDVDPVVGRFYYDVIGPFWPPERRHVDDGYRSLPFPFEEIEAPSFAITQEWNFAHLMGYLATWSAVKEYRRREGRDPLALVETSLAAAWGEPQRTREVRWPLAMRVGRVTQ